MSIFWSALAVVLSLGISLPATADGSGELERLIKSESSTSSSETAVAPSLTPNDNILRLTPDRTHIVRLQEDAASVIVTNPAHATVSLDSPRLLVVMPRQPGATSFTVLNSKGDAILEQDVVVTAAQPRYVRVRRMCGANDSSCTPNAYFYCPDGCYEVMTVPGEDGPADVPEIAGSPQGGAPAANSGPVMPPQGTTQQSENPAERDTDLGDDEIDEEEREQNRQAQPQAPVEPDNERGEDE